MRAARLGVVRPVVGTANAHVVRVIEVVPPIAELSEPLHLCDLLSPATRNAVEEGDGLGVLGFLAGDLHSPMQIENCNSHLRSEPRHDSPTSDVTRQSRRVWLLGDIIVKELELLRGVPRRHKHNLTDGNGQRHDPIGL